MMPTKTATEVIAAQRMANVRYALRDLAVVADEVAREGHKILYLNVGDPCKFDFPPPHMIEAVNYQESALPPRITPPAMHSFSGRASTPPPAGSLPRFPSWFCGGCAPVS
jgi:hypothetical protein